MFIKLVPMIKKYSGIPKVQYSNAVRILVTADLNLLDPTSQKSCLRSGRSRFCDSE